MISVDWLYKINSWLIDDFQGSYAFVGRLKHESTFKDIDIAINPKKIGEISRVLKTNFADCGFLLAGKIDNDYSLQFYFYNLNKRLCLQVDLLTYFTCRGVEYLKLDFERDVEEFQGLPVLDDVALNAYVLLRNYLWKGKADLRYNYLLSEQLDTSSIMVCSKSFDKKIISSIFKNAREGSKKNKIDILRLFTSCFPKSFPYFLRYLYKAGKRYLNGHGVWVVFLGPDGVGKSSVINEIRSRDLPLSGFKYHHLFPGFFSIYGSKRVDSGAVSNPHHNQDRGAILSVLKQIFWLFEYLCGYLFITKNIKKESKLLISDRYFYDALVDKKRYRFSGKLLVLKMMRTVLPEPDLLICLDASPSVIFNRKGELSIDKIQPLRDGYKDLSKKFKNGYLVNTEKEINVVGDEICDLIVKVMISR